MRCYCCDKETDNLRRDPDGTFISICSTCSKIIRDCNRLYEDIDEDELDLKLAKMSSYEFIKELDKQCKKEIKK